MSTVRAVRIPTPSDISPFSSRSRAAFRTFIVPTSSFSRKVTTAIPGWSTPPRFTGQHVHNGNLFRGAEGISLRALCRRSPGYRLSPYAGENPVDVDEKADDRFR